MSEVLSKQEREVALNLLALRPPVLPGTRAILDEAAAYRWFGAVTTEMKTLGIKPDDKVKIQAFCDVAGVAD